MKTWQKMVVSMGVFLVMAFVMLKLFVILLFGARFYLDSRISDNIEWCQQSLRVGNCKLDRFWEVRLEKIMFNSGFYVGVPVVVSGLISGLLLKKTVWKTAE